MGIPGVKYIDAPEPLKSFGYERTPGQILQRDCLDVAREAIERNPPNRVGLLVCGRTSGPRDLHDRPGQSKHVLDNSKLRERVEQFEGGPGGPRQTVPELGGIYVPRVEVHKTPGDEFHVNMLYAASSKGRRDRDHAAAEPMTLEEQQRMRTEMTTKVRNILRIFHER